MEVGERDRRRRGDGAEASSSQSLRRSIEARRGRATVLLSTTTSPRGVRRCSVPSDLMDPEGWTVGWRVHPAARIEGVIDFCCTSSKPVHCHGQKKSFEDNGDMVVAFICVRLCLTEPAINGYDRYLLLMSRR
jgi:hypothetical protein